MITPGAPTREAIYSALFALVTPLIKLAPPYANPNVLVLPSDGSIVPTPTQPFRTISRDVIEVQRIEVGNQPVLMLFEMNEEFGGNLQGTTIRTWTAVFIFGVTSPKGTPGQTILNPLIDLVEAALQPPDIEENQTLGGLVEKVEIRGAAGKDHGNNSTREARQASYYLPVVITLKN